MLEWLGDELETSAGFAVDCFSVVGGVAIDGRAQPPRCTLADADGATSAVSSRTLASVIRSRTPKL